MRKHVHVLVLGGALAVACGSVATTPTTKDAGGAHDAAAQATSSSSVTSSVGSSSLGIADGGEVITCLVPVLGEVCSTSNATTSLPIPCTQPENPCAAGYIWSCDEATELWIKEGIECFTPTNQMTSTTAACPAGQILVVNDAAGSPCLRPGDGGPGDAGCGNDGGYYFEPGCCYFPTNAECMPPPSGCEGSKLSCGCALSSCNAICGGAINGVSCVSAIDGVVDCLCGKV